MLRIKLYATAACTQQLLRSTASRQQASLVGQVLRSGRKSTRPIPPPSPVVYQITFLSTWFQSFLYCYDEVDDTTWQGSPYTMVRV